jgi:hypothetical protein
MRRNWSPPLARPLLLGGITVPIPPAVVTALTTILPQLPDQLLEAYKHKTELDLRRYEAELQHAQAEAERSHRATEARLNREFARAEADRSREHDLRRIWEEAKVSLWYSAERDIQQARDSVRPFSMPHEDLQRMLRRASRDGTRPLLLFAPLRDESKSAAESDTSPQYFRTGPRNYWSTTPWSADAEPMEGLFSRPLHRGDLDIYLIREELGELPVLLVNVNLQASGRLWFTVTGWGLQDGTAGIRVQFPYLTAPTQKGPGGSLVRQDALLEIEDQVCAQFAPVVAQLLDWFYLTRQGRVPRLHRTLPAGLEDQRAVVAAGSLSGFLIAERDQVLNRLDALIGATQVAVEGELGGLPAELMGRLTAVMAEEPGLISDQTAASLARLSAAARGQGDLQLTAAAYEALENATRQLLYDLPGGGL